ncbi:hypothetical protein DI272_27180 [Streptomyces sp. Act143]|uniref:CdiA C-terminal domain-containing protein n=1 Tax=Streptomyces sp. Act143 TaxID=2200760 RepID=UPI000D67E17D|nr:hypothetical protein [Streptomyces sp. Act143]PWI17432.1 hypothetical protein DI272_27180 [Streptomyces sp. Act143]
MNEAIPDVRGACGCESCPDRARTGDGLGLAALGAGEEIGSGLLDATGIGAAIGIPINVAAAAQIGVGLSVAGAGRANIMQDAAGPDRRIRPRGHGGGQSRSARTMPPRRYVRKAGRCIRGDPGKKAGLRRGTENPRSIWSAVQKKVDAGQTDGVVLNLRDSDADLGALRSQFQNWPMGGLKEVTVIDRAGNVVHLYP